MGVHDPSVLPEGLPVPQDDGACDHLLREPTNRLPAGVELDSTDGTKVRVSELRSTVVFAYPRTGVPGQAPSLGFQGETWESIPGARGCTPQSCGYGSLVEEFAALGVKVLGLSTNTTAHQREFKARTSVGYEFVSDAKLALTRAMGLPTFEFPVESGGPTTLLRRMAWFVDDAGVIAKVWYPVFPPDKNASTVLAWLKGCEARARAVEAALAERERVLHAMGITVREAGERDRSLMATVFTQHFGNTLISSRERWIDTAKLPGLVAEVDGRVAAVLAHEPMVAGRECELVALVAVVPGVRAGRLLLRAFAERAERAGCVRGVLTTSNDNLPALGLYQKEGWRLVRVYPDALTRARLEKPTLAAKGHGGIEVRDDLELELRWR